MRYSGAVEWGGGDFSRLLQTVPNTRAVADKPGWTAVALSFTACLLLLDLLLPVIASLTPKDKMIRN